MDETIKGGSVTSPLCNLDRLAHTMEVRGIDGLVITTPQNVAYLSGFNSPGPQADELPAVAVFLSRHELQHPILIAPDLHLSSFVNAPIWVDDLRPYRSGILPLSVPTEPSVFNKFIPASQQDAAWVKRARGEYVESLTEACSKATQDLGLGTGRVAFDDLRLAKRMAGSMTEVVDAYHMMMFVRQVKTDREVQLLREATQLNQVAIERTVRSWSRGMTWKELIHTYHCEAVALGGFIAHPGGVLFANPLDGDPAVRLHTESEDFVIQAGTNFMLDCHGTKNFYCWDGGKTWVVEDEPKGMAGRIARATAEAMQEIQQSMRPGVRISELQEKSQRTFHRLGVPQSQSVMTYFHGLGLSHMDLEGPAEDGADPDWALEEGMVIAAHLLCPGDEKQRCWIEDVVLVKQQGVEAFFTWGNEPLTNG